MPCQKKKLCFTDKKGDFTCYYKKGCKEEKKKVKPLKSWSGYNRFKKELKKSAPSKARLDNAKARRELTKITKVLKKGKLSKRK